ncbi:glycyl radical protein [Chloroflexota bacterium]
MVVELSIDEKCRYGMLSGVGSTERIRKLNSRAHSTPPTICLHRARAYTAVFAETEGEPIVLRRAKAFKRTLEELPVTIGEDELIVGRRACRLRSVPVVSECHGGWLQWDIENLPLRPQDRFQVPPEQMVEAKKILESWKGKTFYDIWSKVCPEELATKVTGTGWADVTIGVFLLGYHFTPPWERILNSGLRPFEEEVQSALSRLDLSNREDMGREHFLKALLIIITAIKDFSHRYAERALILADTEENANRRQDLLRIAETCERVPYEGARSFFEAIQSLWFTQMLFHIEGTGPVYTIGRFDQYMHPFYKTDMDKGILSREGALELIEHLYINLTDNLFMYDTQSASFSAGFSQFQVISLGGVDNLGKDASNELSYLCLEAAESARTTQPDIVLLCHPRETPYKLKMKAADLLAMGTGLPKFFNTETIKTQLMELGYTRDEASLGWIRGCSGPYGPGSKQYGHQTAGCVNPAISLETVLFNGHKRTPNQKWSGQQIGLPTGDPVNFKTFDEFMNAFKEQLAQQILEAHIASSYQEMVQAEHFPLLLQSVLTDDCINKGLAANAGGARINVGPGMSFTGGWGTVADSLAAIKKLVYEDKKISMEELIQAIDADFEGYESIQRMLINDAPKFGNDIDYVDDIAREIFQFGSNQVRQHTGPMGNKNVPASNLSTAYITFGRFVWATPDGRKAGTPISPHVAPTEQMDKDGPVAHMNSVTKLGLERQSGTIHNMYFTNINSEEKKHKLIDFIDAYHSRGGHHIQINCIEKEILMDAQNHPENYPTLIVRVAGYVAYFVELSKKVQDSIISRTSLRV